MPYADESVDVCVYSHSRYLTSPGIKLSEGHVAGFVETIFATSKISLKGIGIHSPLDSAVPQGSLHGECKIHSVLKGRGWLSG